MMPELDKRTRDMVVQEIRELSLSYTPEWRFQPEKPDIGTALALLYADVMCRIIGEYNQVLEWNRTAFFQALGAERMKAGKAEGYMAFQLSRADMPEAVVSKGAGVAVDGKQEGLIRYETLEEVYVSASSVRLLKEENSGCYLVFDKKPEHGLLSILLVLRGWEQRGRCAVRWEYYGEGGWEPVCVEDGTDGFCHTGILRFAGDPGFCETTVGGTSGFWVRGRREDGGKVPAAVMEVYGNAAGVRAKKPGTAGNRMPGKNHKLMQSIGYVTRIQNPDVLYGGSGEETMEQAIARNSARIRHQFRAVTPGDFEALVYEIFPDIRKVTCFPGVRGDGTSYPGAVTVVVLQRDFMEGRHYFYRMQEEIQSRMQEWADGLALWEGRLWVVQPVFIRMNIRAEVLVRHHGQVLEAEREIRRELEHFLDPVDGGYDGNGWEFGGMPEYGQIKRLLQKRPEVCYVKQLWISYEQDRDGLDTEIEEEEVRRMAWALPVRGNHQITAGVVPGAGRRQ